MTARRQLLISLLKGTRDAMYGIEAHPPADPEQALAYERGYEIGVDGRDLELGIY